MEQNVGQLERKKNRFRRKQMRMLIRIKGVTLRDEVKSVDIRKELGVNSIKERIREMRLRYTCRKWKRTAK